MARGIWNETKAASKKNVYIIFYGCIIVDFSRIRVLYMEVLVV